MIQPKQDSAGLELRAKPPRVARLSRAALAALIGGASLLILLGTIWALRPPTLRDFVDELAAGLARLGGERCDIIDEVPHWWLDGHRKEPTGRPPGRPKGAKDRKPRNHHVKTLPADT